MSCLPHKLHIPFLFPSILQVCCLVFMCAVLVYVSTPADAARSVPDHQLAQHRPPPTTHDRLQGVIRLPVSHKSISYVESSRRHGRGRRTLDPTPESQLVTLGESLGQFFATLQIGTPGQDIAVIIDSGSELLWIQCEPCVQCGLQEQDFPIFDPADSSSFQTLPCGAPTYCSEYDQTVALDCLNASNACTYKVVYGDLSNSSGVLAQEPLTFATSEANASSSVTLAPLVFGCGTDNEGVETHFNASGIMGLNRGTYSIVSQLGLDAFSYCLPDRTLSVDVTGYLTLGSVAESSTPSSNIPQLQYTPMIQNNYTIFELQFYYLSLIGISINGQTLAISAAAFQLNATGSGGTFIDSGTTFTGFVEDAFTVFIQAFENAMGSSSYDMVDLGYGIPCYRVPLSEQVAAPPTAPAVTLHFDGPVDLELGSDQLFYLDGYDATTTSYDYCLAMQNQGTLASGARNVIGNYQQQNFLVEYDIANSRIGFAPTQCSPQA